MSHPHTVGLCRGVDGSSKGPPHPQRVGRVCPAAGAPELMFTGGWAPGAVSGWGRVPGR